MISVAIKTRSLPSGQWGPVSNYNFTAVQDVGCQAAFSGNSEVNFVWSSSDLQSGDYVVYKLNSVQILKIDSLNPSGSITVPFSAGDALCWDINVGSASSVCEDDSDCPDGEKCVDGVCVPCDKVVDGKGIVTLWGVQMSDGTIMSDGLPVDISSGVATVQLSNFDPSYLTVGRIQIFNGMSGTLTVKAGIGVLGSDFGANVTLFSGSVSGHYQDFLFDSGNLSFGYSFNGKITFEILNYDTLGDCADDDVDDTPDDPPIDVVDGGEPQPPGGSGPGTVTQPGGTNTIIKVIVIKPSPPDNGCECEKYLADALYYNFDSLGNRIIDFTNTFDSRFSEQNFLLHSLLSDQSRILFEQLSESNRLSYELSLFLARKLYPQLVNVVSSLQSLRDDVRLMRIELESIHDEVESIDDTLRKGLILPECGSEPEKGIVEVFDEFSQKYEPVDVVVEESDVWQHSPDEAPRNYPRKL